MRTPFVLLICAASLSVRATAQNDLSAIRVVRDCGRERWDVKTLRDIDTLSIDFDHPKEATVDQLTRMRAFQPTEYMVRQWFEHTVYRVRATLYGYGQNHDRDLVLYLRDPASKRTMVSVIPDPDCPEVAATSRAPLFRSARQWVAEHAGPPNERIATPIEVIVSGVAMYNRLNDQTGMSENGLEIHPVLSIDEVPQAPIAGPSAAVPARGPAQATQATQSTIRRHRRTIVRRASIRWRRGHGWRRGWRHRRRRTVAAGGPVQAGR